MSEFQRELAALINKHSIENETNTPDFILAIYLNDCLNSLATLMDKRDAMAGKKTVPVEVNDVQNIK